LQKFDLSVWVNQAPNDKERQFREAVHTNLVAISDTPTLNTTMALKGGILLAIQHGSARFTRDIDFSTPQHITEFDENAFLSDLSQSLAIAVEKLDYALDCLIQSHERRPPTPDASFPTLKLRIGYAYKHEKKHKRLLNRQCPTVVELDYSFNEPNNESTRVIELIDGGILRAYSIIEVIAEKLRAMLQQETRNRIRRQDAYDLYCLLRTHSNLQDSDKHRILASLRLKAKARDMAIDRGSISHSEVIRRSRTDYPRLAQEIDGVLPAFEDIYPVVKDFYESLPWLNS